MALSEQERVRREKLAQLKSNGINPYPAHEVDIDTHTSDIKSNFVEGKSVKIAG